MAKRYIRRRGWKALPGGGAIRTGNPDDELLVEAAEWAVTNGRVEVVELRKGHTSMDRDEIYALLEKRQVELDDPWPASDPVWAGLYEAYKRAPPAAAGPVAKAAVPGDGVWDRIVALAKNLRDTEPGALTEVESINQILEQRPDLFREYCRRQAAGLE